LRLACEIMSLTCTVHYPARRSYYSINLPQIEVNAKIGERQGSSVVEHRIHIPVVVGSNPHPWYKLRKDYPQIPIVGIVPVIKTAVKETKNGKIGVFSTVVTAKSKQQNDLIKEFAKGCKVTNTGSAKLVSLIEKLDFKAVNKILDQELGVFKTNKVDVLVLGCSHFSLIRDRIQKYLPKVLILDSGEAVVRQVRRILEHNKMLSNSGKASYNFYTTGSLETLNFFAGKLTNRAKLSRISLR
jgi:glutamate racemase